MKRFNSIRKNLVGLKIKDNKIKQLCKYITTTNSIKLKRFIDIPGPRSFPLVGNLFAYKEFGKYIIVYKSILM
jgi:hypothetical protein